MDSNAGQKPANKNYNSKHKRNTNSKHQSKKPKSNYFDKYNKNMFIDFGNEVDTYIRDFLKKLRDNIEQNLLVDAGSKLLLAVSGGVDSVVMLDAVFQLAKDTKYDITVCHFNHKLRDISSDADERFVRNLAYRYGVRHNSDSGDVKANAKQYGQSIELAARNMRYNYFERLSKSMNIPFILLAHTANDSAETLLLNLLRGSGLTGLSGIPEQRVLNKGKLVSRPMMIFKKDELIEYARLRNLKWSEDESNSMLDFTRNKLRLDLIKKIENEYNPRIIDTLNRTAILLKMADNFIKEHMSPYLGNFRWSNKDSVLTISIQLFESCGPFIQGEILQAKLKDKFNHGALSMQQIEKIIELPNLEVGSIIELGRNIIALRDRNRLVFTRRQDKVIVDLDLIKEGEFKTGNYTIKLSKVIRKKVSINDNPNVEYFDYDLVPAMLKLRTWEPGDYFYPLGMSGKMKISDFLINNKVSLLDKKSVLVFASRNDILWVCGMRIDDRFKVTGETNRCLKVKLIEIE